MELGSVGTPGGGELDGGAVNEAPETERPLLSEAVIDEAEDEPGEDEHGGVEHEEAHADLARRIAELEADLARAEARLAAQAQRTAVERELAAAGVVDLETGLALAERLFEGGDEDDPVRAVARIRARKPFLFETRRERASAMSGEAPGTPGALSAELDEIASSARATGDRKELLRYLRARRGG
ncbi:MAG: hypothetical protein AAGI53_04070 [Planctomycetota bacterium]